MQSTSANYTCKGVGINFYTQLPMDWSTYLYPNVAALYLQQAITDTSAWISVNGMFLPDSAYTQLVIGNFFDDNHSAPFIFDTTGFGTAGVAYVFIDQICVSFDSGFCDKWTGFKQVEKPSILIGPNPFGATLRLSAFDLEHAPVLIQLFDGTGRVIESREWQAGLTDLVLDGTDFAPGYYTLLITNTQGASRSYALIHVSP